MAITIQEEKRQVPWMAIIVFLAIFIVIIMGAYYFFFAPIPLIEVVKPVKLKEISELGEVGKNLQKLINNQDYGKLKIYVELPVTEPNLIGKINPFLP